jgi:hypothetical protein
MVALSSELTQGNSKTPIPVISASNGKLYVLLKDTNSNGLLLTYSVTKNQLMNNPGQFKISGNFVGMAAVPNTLFLLVAGGAIESMQLPPGSQPLAVFVQQQIAAPLLNSDVAFDPLKATMSVPVPQNVPVSQQNQSLTVPGATTLAAAVVNNTSHLYVSDPVNHRILDLTVQQTTLSNGASPTQPAATSRAGTPSPTPRGTSLAATVPPATNLTLQIFQQVFSSTYFNQVMSVAVDPQVMTTSVLVQMPQTSSSNSSSRFGLIPLSTGLQMNCMMQAGS